MADAQVSKFVGFFFYLTKYSAMCFCSDPGWAPTSMESSHSTKSSPLQKQKVLTIDWLPSKILEITKTLSSYTEINNWFDVSRQSVIFFHYHCVCSIKTWQILSMFNPLKKVLYVLIFVKIKSPYTHICRKWWNCKQCHYFFLQL